jgi:hypothetical protein
MQAVDDEMMHLNSGSLTLTAEINNPQKKFGRAIYSNLQAKNHDNLPGGNIHGRYYLPGRLPAHASHGRVRV